MKKYTYQITGLDCANCAKRIEDALNKQADFKNVVVNFSTSKITYETNLDNSLQLVNKIVKDLEPGAKLIYQENTKSEYHLWIIILALMSFIIGSFNFPLSEIFILIAYIILLFKPLEKALLLLIKSKTINENFLIVISCLGAYFLGSKMEGVMVVTLYLIGKILEERALNTTRQSIKDLLTLKQDYANLKKRDKLEKITVEEIKINDILIVKKGEKVPVDGIIMDGNAYLNTSSITGESDIKEANVGDLVYSGYLNTGDIFSLKATKTYENSMINKILELVETASNRKAKTETTVSKLSRYYTPVILVLAFLTYLLLPLLFKVSYHDSLYRALTFLVVACPCAIAISVPLAYFVGLGVSSKNGILIKGSNYLDNMSHLNKIIFDKTGTLTTGNLEVKNLEILTKDFTKQELIDIIFAGEILSNHPIAKSITKLKKTKDRALPVQDFQEVEGKGITYKCLNHKIKIGNQNLCNCNEIADLHVNIDNKHVATIIFQDEIKENAKEVIQMLKRQNIKTYLFTGDKKDKALELAKKLDIDEVYYEMLPTDKYAMYEKQEKEKDIIAYLGDGVNDAPVLKRASIGISMGTIGSDSAISVSDIVIMNDNLDSILTSIKISKTTNQLIKENLIFALSVKIIILILSLFGLTNMWIAVLADTGVTVLTILNTLRIKIK